MPYKLVYTATIEFVGAGAGPMEVLSNAAGQMLPGSGGGAQAKSFVTNPATIPVVLGAGAGTFPANQLASGDITTLLAAMSADLSTQLNAALPTINQWPSGGP